MITEQQINIGKQLLSTGLITRFFHSVSLAKDPNGNSFYPVYKNGTDEEYVGPDDSSGRFAYIRQTGPVRALEELKEGSENKSYRVGCVCRIVVFKDNEESDFDELIKKLLKPIFCSSVSFLSFSNDSYALSKEECPEGEYDFDASTFYLAIDVDVKWIMSLAECEVIKCTNYQNPICS